MDRKSYDLERLFNIPEKIEYKKLNTSFKESLTKILEALYIQKIKQTNSDFLSILSFKEILNLPSLVSESIFNALIPEPRDYIKLEEFVEGLSFLFDRNIDFVYNEKTNIPKIYEILFKIFCLKKLKSKVNNINFNNISNLDNYSSLNSQSLSINTPLTSQNNSYVYRFIYNFDLESFNKIISNILLVIYINANNFKIEEFLPLCEEIKLIVKKTFTISNNKNNYFNNFSSNNSNINLNITSYNNNNFPHFLASQNNLNIKSFKENEKEISCSNLNINLNFNNNCDTNMNLNMNMQNNVNMNLNLNMNINNISTISENVLNRTNNQCSNCHFCMNCSQSNFTNNNFENNINFPKTYLSLEEFVECFQKNSKLLFILLFLFYALSPINQKLIYLLMKNPTSKIIDDECDFIAEDEKTGEIQAIPDSVKKVNLDDIKSNSRIMSENNSINDSFDSNSNLNNNNNNYFIKKFERNSSINSKKSDSSKLSHSYSVGMNLNNDKNFYDIIEENIIENLKIEKENNKNTIKEISSGKLIFDLSEETDSFSQSNINLNSNNNLTKTKSNFNKSETFHSRSNSQNGSSTNLNNFTNKSKFFNTKSLFNYNLNDLNNLNIINNAQEEEQEDDLLDEKSKIIRVNSCTNQKFHFPIRKITTQESNNFSMFAANSNSFIRQNIENEHINKNSIDSAENYYNKNFNNSIKNRDIQIKNNVINFNLDDDSNSTFSQINSIQKKNYNNSINNSKSQNKISIGNNKDNTSLDTNKSKNEDTNSHIIVYRHNQTNESSHLTNNNNIFDSKIRESFDNIITSNRDEYPNENTNNIYNVINDFSRINTKNSLYNDFNDFLLLKNKTINSNNINLNFNVSRSHSSKLISRNGNNKSNNIYFNDFTNNFDRFRNTKNSNENIDKNLTNIYSINNNDLDRNFVNNNLNKNINEQFAFEEVFSEFKVKVEKVKISKDFIFDTKKCEKFSYHSKNNKNFSFKNFNFNIENDWVMRNLKDLYQKMNDYRISEIRNFNRNFSFLTVYFQFNTANEYSINKPPYEYSNHKLLSKNSKNSNNKNFYTEENLIKERSKRLEKSIADLIDEYFVVFTFKNAFEANLIHNYINNNKQKIFNKINNYDINDKNYLIENEECNFYDENNNNKNKSELYLNPKYSEKNNNLKHPVKKFSINKSENANGNSIKDTMYGFSDKTTNYKNTINNCDSKENNSKNYLLNNNVDYFQYKENINFTNKLEEGNSEVISLLDIYESNDFFSLNLNLIVNLRNCDMIPLEEKFINEVKFFPLKIKQDENLYVFFFETEIEREILINYHKEKILNINPIKNYDSQDIISKTKCLEFTKGTNKITKDNVEIKKYIKNNIKSDKILIEINSLRDLSMVYKFFVDSKIPKILFFENSEEIYVVYENYENDPIKFIFMNPEMKITKDVSKYSLNIKKMKELKNMLEILSISLSPDRSDD